MGPLWGRITEAFDAKNPAEIARELGIGRGAVYKWRDRKNAPSIETLIRIAELTNRSLDWLLTGNTTQGIAQGTGSLPVAHGVEISKEDATKIRSALWAMYGSLEPRLFKTVMELVTTAFSQPEYDATKQVQVEYYGQFAQSTVGVPLLGTISAGTPLEPGEENDVVDVAASFKELAGDRNIFALRVRGQSMIDEGIPDGSLIVCHEASDANNGATVVALVDGSETTVKKFFRNGRNVILRPANKEMDDMVFASERVVIQGIVMGTQRSSWGSP